MRIIGDKICDVAAFLKSNDIIKNAVLFAAAGVFSIAVIHLPNLLMGFGIHDPAIIKHLSVAAFTECIDAQVHRLFQSKPFGHKFIIVQAGEVNDCIFNLVAFIIIFLDMFFHTRILHVDGQAPEGRIIRRRRIPLPGRMRTIRNKSSDICACR